MPHFILTYELARDYIDRRVAFRAEHLAYARAAVARGELLLGGALTEPVDRALLLFSSSDTSAAEAFARADPYVTNGLVERWSVRRWMTVVGNGAAERIC